jgi:hypothetical protein
VDERSYALWRLGAWCLLERHRGRRAIYVQGRHRFLVRLLGSRASPDLIAASLEALDEPGFACPQPGGRRFELRSTWDAITYDDRHLACSALRADLFLAPDVVLRAIGDADQASRDAGHLQSIHNQKP